MKTITKKTYLMISLAFLLSSCGNKNDLYMPEKDQDTSTQTVK
ncbi:MAG: lipoprotein [Proteobacteria bacterium]|nr:lipoprotein [Pseudomonadota bacterium]